MHIMKNSLCYTQNLLQVKQKKSRVLTYSFTLLIVLTRISYLGTASALLPPFTLPIPIPPVSPNLQNS